jgi:dienelactone hydrolase
LTGLRLLVGLVGVLATGAGLAAPDDINLTFDRGAVRIGDNIVERLGIDLKAARTIADASGEDDWQKAYNRAQLDLITQAAKPGQQFPVIVYAHGCSGMSLKSRNHVSMLYDLGDYVVVAPDSFARKRPISCWSPGVIDREARRISTILRKAEIVHALDRIAALPWIDKRSIFLVGHSQGGGVVLGYGGDVRIKGRISLNGACYTRFPQTGSTGNGARSDEFILAFHSGRDPWYEQWYSECPEMVRRHPNGRLVEDAKDSGHNLIAQPRYLDIFKAWLTEHTD